MAPRSRQQQRLSMFKNLIDRSLAGIGLVILSPLMLAFAGLIRVRMGKPVLFRQLRIGHREKVFTFLKFRTMTDVRDQTGKLLADEQRLTALGRFLRSSGTY